MENKKSFKILIIPILILMILIVNNKVDASSEFTKIEKPSWLLDSSVNYVDLENENYSFLISERSFFSNQKGELYIGNHYSESSYREFFDITNYKSLTGTIKIDTLNIPYDFINFKKGNSITQLEIDKDEFYFEFTNASDYEYGEIFFSNELRPAISGQENFATNIDLQKPVNYFINFLTAIDDYDGDISDEIYIVTDNYTPNISVLGRHNVVVGVKDSSDNESLFEFYVHVVDVTAPVISGNNSTIEISYTKTFDINNFKSTLVASDNYDNLNNADIKIKSDNYTVNKKNLGTYDVIFKLKDTSNNSSIFTKKIKVIDDVAPVFSGTENIVKSHKEILTIQNIISQVTAFDEKEGNVTNKIIIENENYTGYGDKKGTYYIDLSVQDTAGNKATWRITIKVIDDTSPGWFIVNNITINLAPGAELTRTQLIELLVKSNQIQAEPSAVVTYTQDTYTENIGTPGVYSLAFKVSNPGGTEHSYTYAINVLDEDSDDDKDVIPEKKNNMIVYILVGFGAICVIYYIYKKSR